MLLYLALAETVFKASRGTLKRVAVTRGQPNFGLFEEVVNFSLTDFFPEIFSSSYTYEL